MLALVLAGAAMAQTPELLPMPKWLTYRDAVDCAGLAAAMGGDASGRDAGTFRDLAARIDGKADVTADIAAARAAFIDAAAGSEELPLGARLMMTNGELGGRCSGYRSQIHIELINRSYRH